MSYRTRNVLVASGLALLAVVFMLVYISKARSSADGGKKLVGVLVAAHDIQEGTPGSTLQGGAFVVRRVPRNAVVPEPVSTASQVGGEVVTDTILKGEQVSLRNFGPAAAAGVRSQIQRRDRAVQLVGPKSQVLDGTLKAGDHVDIVASWSVPEKCAVCHVSRTIVRNALVLDTSADLGGAEGDSSDAYPVQLRLTDAEAERVFWMVKNGSWWLVLRPVLKARSSRQGYDNSRSILDESLKRNGPSR
jgi:Flp pilus assembly protein CpaB